MSRDPYHDVKRDVESNLNQCQALLASYLRLANVAGPSSSSNQNQNIREAHEDLRNCLSLLDADLEDLEDSVLAVEESGMSWGMDELEVRQRRAFLDKTKKQVQQIRSQTSPSQQQTSDPFQDVPLSSHASPLSTAKDKRSSHSFAYADDMERGDAKGDGKDARRSHEPDDWEQEQQQMIMRQQDTTLDVISGSLRTLAAQAGLIGQEVGEQNEMLDDLSLRVDETDSRLQRANKRLKHFIRKNEESKSGWCIAILIFVLIILLLLVIIT